MTTAANWFFNWLLSFITPYLLGGLKPEQSNVFWIWGSFCWIAVVFVFFLVSRAQAACIKNWLLTLMCRSTRPRTFLLSKSMSSTRTRARHGSRRSTAPPSGVSLRSLKAAIALTTMRRRDGRSPLRMSPKGNAILGSLVGFFDI